MVLNLFQDIYLFIEIIIIIVINFQNICAISIKKALNVPAGFSYP